MRNALVKFYNVQGEHIYTLETPAQVSAAQTEGGSRYKLNNNGNLVREGCAEMSLLYEWVKATLPVNAGPDCD